MPVPATEGSDLDERILDAAAAVIGRWGLAKTTLADVAKEARCGRATVYRAFPGGKDHLFGALGRRELGRFFVEAGALLDEADTLEDALVAGFVAAARFAGGHGALQFLLAHEPEAVLPYLGFGHVDRLYRAAAVFAGPHLERFCDPATAAWAAEWTGRTVLSHLFNPAPDEDPTDPAVARRVVRRFIVPALSAHPLDPDPRRSPSRGPLARVDDLVHP